MNKVIWKYPLKVDDTQELIVPKLGEASHILNITVQRDTPVLYLIVNTDKTDMTDTITIRCAGTGHILTDADHCVYLATTMLRNDNLVLHWFIENPNYQVS